MGQLRDIELLCRVVRDKAVLLMQECERMGVPIMLIETLRKPLTQKAYYAQGREPLDNVNIKRHIAGLYLITAKQNERTITNTLESTHFFECALDFAILIDGKPSWDSKADINNDDVFDYGNVGHIGESLGFKWGGRFRFKDYAHLQFTGGLTREQLRAGVRPA